MIDGGPLLQAQTPPEGIFFELAPADGHAAAGVDDGGDAGIGATK